MSRVSEFGRKWNSKVPRYSIRHHVGSLHVSTPAADIEREIRELAKDKPGWTKSLVDQAVRYALICHTNNIELYHHVMRGA